MDLQITHSEPYDINHVQEVFPNLDSAISQRLGRAITQRRKHIKYRAEQHGRLEKGLKLEFIEHTRGEDRRTTEPSLYHQNLSNISQLDLNDFELPASSNPMDASEIPVPALPKDYSGGPLLCPFCFMVISVETSDEWK